MIEEDDVLILRGVGVVSIVSTHARPLLTVRLPDGHCIRADEGVVERLRCDGVVDRIVSDMDDEDRAL